MIDEQKQKRRDYQREYIKNMTDEQKQKLKDYRREYYKKYCAAKKLNKKQKLKDYRREYYKKYCAAKKLNNKTIDDEIIDDDSFMMIVMPVIMKTIFNMLFFSKCI